MTDERRRLFQRALDAHRRGDLDAASKDYASLLEAVPDHVDAMHMFAMLHHQRGDSERALSLLNSALSLSKGGVGDLGQSRVDSSRQWQ